MCHGCNICMHTGDTHVTRITCSGPQSTIHLKNCLGTNLGTSSADQAPPTAVEEMTFDHLMITFSNKRKVHSPLLMVDSFYSALSHRKQLILLQYNTPIVLNQLVCGKNKQLRHSEGGGVWCLLLLYASTTWQFGGQYCDIACCIKANLMHF